MAKAVGIDIGSKSLKVLELEGAGSKLKINRFFDREIPFGSDNDSASDLLVEAIRRIFREHRLERDNLALSIPTQECILRVLTVDFVDDNQIKQMIKFEMEKYLQAYEIDDVIVDYRRLDTLNSKSRLFVVAVPKKVIRQKLDLLKECDLDPIIIDLDIMALVNVARFCPEATSKDTVAIIDFGAGSTKIVILHKGNLQHVRAIRLGASIHEEKPATTTKEETTDIAEEDIDWDIENQLIVSLPSPDGINLDRMVLVQKDKNKSIVASQEEKKQAVFDRFIKELRRTMLTLHLEHPIDQVFLSGGGSQLEGLIDRIKESFSIEAMLFDYTPQVPSLSEVSEDMLVCAPVSLGLASELLNDTGHGMNFRKEEFSYTNRFELLKLPLAILATMLVLLFFILAYHCGNKKSLRAKEYSELIAKAEKIWKRNFPTEAGLSGSKFRKIYLLYDRMARDGDSGTLKAPPVADGLWRWHVLMNYFAKVRNRYYITVDKFDLLPKECVFEGEVESDGVMDMLTRVMQTNKNYQLQTLPSTRINDSPSDPKLKRRYRFQVDLSNMPKKPE